MNTNRLLISVVGLALMASPAFAKGVPIISGTYAASYDGTCQAVQSTGNPGSVNKSVFIITFTPNSSNIAGAVHTEGSRVHGDLMVWPVRTEGMTVNPETRDTSYSNTETTVTFGNENLRAVYGPMNARGTPQSLLLVGIHGPDGPDSHCAVSFVLIHQ